MEQGIETAKGGISSKVIKSEEIKSGLYADDSPEYDQMAALAMDLVDIFDGSTNPDWLDNGVVVQAMVWTDKDGSSFLNLFVNVEKVVGRTYLEDQYLMDGEEGRGGYLVDISLNDEAGNETGIYNNTFESLDGVYEQIRDIVYENVNAEIEMYDEQARKEGRVNSSKGIKSNKIDKAYIQKIIEGSDFQNGQLSTMSGNDWLIEGENSVYVESVGNVSVGYEVYLEPVEGSDKYSVSIKMWLLEEGKDSESAADITWEATAKEIRNDFYQGTYIEEYGIEMVSKDENIESSRGSL
ncbi:MAG: hypothetical protein FWE72_06810 [Spirochaetaceae bacterium]|nr:hypothetical protein [Spirochaetaceae bacterium]